MISHERTLLVSLLFGLFTMSASIANELDGSLPDSVVFGSIATIFDDDWMGAQAMDMLRDYGMRFDSDEAADEFSEIIMAITPRMIDEMRTRTVTRACKSKSASESSLTTLRDMDQIAVRVYDKYYQDALAVLNSVQSEQLSELLWHARRDMVYTSFYDSFTQSGSPEANIKEFCNNFGGGAQ